MTDYVVRSWLLMVAMLGCMVAAFANAHAVDHWERVK